MSKTRLALIGAGSMASAFHYPSLAELPDVELVGLCDLVAAKRDALASKLGIERRYADYQQMLEETRPDGVYILMPPYHLFDVTMDCLERGLHVFIEKPPGITTFQTRTLARTAEAHHCITMVGFNRRHDPLLNAGLAEARRHAPITHAHATFFKGESAVYYRGALDVLTSDTIHAIDSLRFMADAPVAHVSSTVAQHSSPVPNAWNALVTFTNGVVGVLQSGYNTGGRIHRFEVHSDGYSAYVEQLTSIEELFRDGRTRRRRSAEEVMGPDAADPRKLNGFYQQAQEFAACVREGRLPSSHFGDAVFTMQLVDDIRLGHDVNTIPPPMVPTGP